MTELYARPLIACLLMTLILTYLGLHVLKREVIFIDIAVAQVSALGAILAHIILHVHGDTVTAMLCAFGATVLAALFFALVRHGVRDLPIEATIGITYAMVAAGALFIIGKAAGGHTHVQEMLAGNLLWVTERDLYWASVVFLAAGILLAVCHRKLQRISDSYGTSSVGSRAIIWWDFLFYAVCGIVITVAVRMAGVVVVFCFLIIPATTSALFSQRWGTRLVIGWVAGLLATLCGLLFCHTQDFSAGVSVALFLGIILVLISLLRQLPGITHTPCEASPPAQPDSAPSS